MSVKTVLDWGPCRPERVNFVSTGAALAQAGLVHPPWSQKCPVICCGGKHAKVPLKQWIH